MAYDPYDPNRTDRTPYTGGLTPQQDPALAPMPLPNSSGQSQLAATRYDGRQYIPTGATPPTAANLGAAIGGQVSNMTPPPDPRSDPRWLSTWNTSLGGNPFSGSGDAARKQAANYDLQAYAASQRQGPQIDTGATNMFAAGTGNALTNANQTNLYGVRQGLDLSALANGQAVQGQMGLASQLAALGRAPAGPSVAEQQLRMGLDRAAQQQASMAAGARGGNAALALQNAAAQQGQEAGTFNESQALLRAQEDLNNRMFAANAAQGAANIYGQAGQQQQNALGGAANVFGNVAGNQLGQANTNLGLTNTYAGLASNQGQLNLGQNELNDRTNLALQGLGYGALSDQRAAEMNNYLQQQQINMQGYGIDKGVAAQLQLQKNAQNNDWWKTLVSGGLAAAGAVGGFFAGGPVGAAGGAVGGYELGNEATKSDVRAKTAIAPASQEVGDAFRPLSSNGYAYREPERYGYGRQYGPMAQELEQTPVGRTAVTTMPDGQKGIDTSRLALLNASATADMRRELDALKGQGNAIRDTAVQYPQARLAYIDAQNQQDAQTLAQIRAAQQTALTALRQPTAYPTLGGYGY